MFPSRVRIVEHTLTPTIDRSDTDDEIDVSEAVVTAVAEAKDISPLEVEPPLATVVDPDSLNALVERMSGAVTAPRCLVEFTYSGHQVTVTGDGNVSLDDPGLDH